MIQLVKRVVRWIAAVVTIVVGLALSIPGIPGPGLPIVLVGVLILLPESRWLRRKYVRFKRRYPKLFAPLERWRRRGRRHRDGARRVGRRFHRPTDSRHPEHRPSA